MDHGWTIRERGWEKAIPLGHEQNEDGTWWVDSDISPEEIILCAAEIQILSGREEDFEDGLLVFEVTRPDGQSSWWSTGINLPEEGLEVSSAWLSPRTGPSEDWYASITDDLKKAEATP